MLYGVGVLLAASTPLVSFEPFAWGDLKFFSRLFQQGTHDFKGRNHGRPGSLCKYVQAHLLQLARLLLQLRSTPTPPERGERGGVVQCSNASEEEVCQLPAATAASRVHGMALLTFMPSRRPMHMRRSASELKQLPS